MALQDQRFIHQKAFIMATQDLSLFIRNYQGKYNKNSVGPICGLCEQHIETIDHLESVQSIDIEGLQRPT